MKTAFLNKNQSKLTLLMMKKKKIKERVVKRERKRQEVAEKAYSKSEKKGWTKQRRSKINMGTSENNQ